MKHTKLKAISIIEVLIAGGILAMILGASVALSRTVTRNQILVQDRTMANSLAAEGIEQIQALNDSTKIDGSVNSFLNLLPDLCKSNLHPENSACQNIEISYLGPPASSIYLEKDDTGTSESDGDPASEVIVVSLNKSASLNSVINPVISDNYYRELNNTTTPLNCSSTSSQQVIYCRKIYISPIVINIANNEGTDPDYDSGTDDAIFPKITDDCEDPTTDKCTFNALMSNAFKVVSEVTWQDYGQTRTVSQTDILTNW